MKAGIVKFPIGIFALSEKGELINFRLFSRNAEKALEEFLAEDKAFVSSLKGYEIKEGSEAADILRKNIREYAVNLGFCQNNEEFNSFICEFSSLLSKKRMKTSIGRDKLLIQAVNALDEVNKISNTLNERAGEWYSLHYPEAKLTPEKIIAYGKRENIPGYNESTGVSLTDEDEAMIKNFAASAKNVGETKKSLEKYIRETARVIMPNFSSLIDELLAARLLSLAGSMEKMARMTSSTIQLLGAEKALFRHIRHQGKSPKYGIIYMDPRIQNSQEKGKIARIIAAKLMIAARIDFYSGRPEEKLKKELEVELRSFK
jgi:nucleolar protein 56